MESIPDWQLPAGVDRGLWDYLHAGEMVAGYDAQMAAAPLAQADVAFCEKWFPTPGRLLDMGCGAGRLCRHFAARGYHCVGVDLSEEMLAAAHRSPDAPLLREGGLATFRHGNLVELADWPDAGFDYAACLFSTLGMVRGRENRAKVLANAFRLAKPGGRFVLHVHNRYFHGLGKKNWGRGAIAMPQAYGGALLTLQHFSRREARRLLADAGFVVMATQSVNVDGTRAGWPGLLRAYGYLLCGERLCRRAHLEE